MDKNKISYGNENDTNLKLLISLSRSVSGINRETMRNIKEYGLTPSQFMVLEVLYHKGEMRVCDITEKILSTGGNMTVVISNLLKENYIEKKNTPGDRRSYSVSLTEKGRKIISEIFPLHLLTISAAMKNIEEDEKLELIRLLRKMQGLDT
ncbi:MAG TPA: MarR family transcriptional regulator [Bacteroidales bacterium]|nr:MarR family transcriptional regulator [Bacteroidales bacterium]